MLKVEDLTTGYGRVPVLEGVSVDVGEGEIVTLLGANGAGKSTLMKAIVGALPAWSGRVTLAGQDVTSVSDHRRVGKGIVLVPEGRMLFSGMSVDENLTLGAYSRTGAQPRPQPDRRSLPTRGGCRHAHGRATSDHR